MNIYRSDKKGAGVGNYPDLTNLPQINGNTLTGDKTSAELGIITKAVDDLVNYYLKTETYSSDEIDTLIETVVATRFEVVQQLPTVDIKTNVIYLVPSQSSSQGHVKDEWINLDGTSQGWEQIGSTAIDLSDYVTISTLNATLTSYVTSTALATALQSYVTSTDLQTALSDYITSEDLESYVTSEDLGTALEDYTTTEDLEDLLAEKQGVFQLADMPTPSADYVGTGIYQYIGTTTGNYTHGYWYECKLVNGSYAWVNVKVQDGDTIQVTSLPSPTSSLSGVILQYIGQSNQNYTNGYFYICEESGGSYAWVNKNVQEGETIQYTSLPSPSSSFENRVVQYTGSSNNFYTNGYFYKCVNNSGTYSWVEVNVQDSEQLQVESLPTASVDTWKMVLMYVGATTSTAPILEHNHWYECVSDGESTPTYSWVEVNVQDDNGHNIQDYQDASMTKRPNLKFGEGVNVVDDSTNEATVADVLPLQTGDMDDIINPLPPTKNGKTATLDSVANWLDCAGVTGVSFSTLADLLDDEDTMNEMFIFPNSAEYLVRNTTWISDVVASEYAMTALSKSEACCNVMLADDTWYNAIIGSSYYDIILKKVPVMTSNTTPKGVAFGDTNALNPYMAFDGNSSTVCRSNADGTKSGYVGYQFTKPINVNLVVFTNYGTDGYKIEASNDGETWTELTYTTSSDKVLVTNTDYYTYYRFRALGAQWGEARWGVRELQFYGRN